MKSGNGEGLVYKATHPMFPQKCVMIFRCHDHCTVYVIKKILIHHEKWKWGRPGLQGYTPHVPTKMCHDI